MAAIFSRLGWLLLGLSLLGVAACGDSDTPVLDASCACAVECAEPRVSAFGLCHTRCTSSASCDASDACVIDEAGDAVCLLSEEATCQFSSDCAHPLACATDHRCRNLCRDDSDCNTAGVVGRACARDGNDVYFCADERDATDGVGEIPGASGDVPPPQRPLRVAGAAGAAG
jgi:hypothetical protein